VNEQYNEQIKNNPFLKSELTAFSIEIIKTIQEMTNNPEFSVSLEQFLILMYTF
jgi:hypothetical protein